MVASASGATTLFAAPQKSQEPAASPASRPRRRSQERQRKWTEGIGFVGGCRLSVFGCQWSGGYYGDNRQPITDNVNHDLPSPLNHFARSRYRFSLGSTMISSPSETNGGTSTVRPFSS